MSLVESYQTGEWPRITIPDGPKAMARRILADVAASHRVTVEDIQGPRRLGPLVMCRREACWRIAKDTDLSLPAIAMILHKDHTSVLSAVRRQNEITGTDVRGWGGTPEKTRARNREAARLSRRRLTRKERLRRADLRNSGNRWLAELDSRQ